MDQHSPHQEPEQPPGHKIGRGMWIITWIMALGLLTLFFAEQEQSWINPNQNPSSSTDARGVQEVILKQNRQGHYVVNGQVNGHTTTMLLDTGATDVAVPGHLADKLGLVRGAPGVALTANGRVTVYRTRIDRLQIGDIILYDVPASINPQMNMKLLLGMSALKQVEFTQQADTLTLRRYPRD